VKEGWPGHVQYYFENLDGARIANEKYESKYVNFLQEKYAGEHLDRAYAIAPEACRFLLKYRDSLIPGTPIVFVASAKNGVPEVVPGSDTTGVLGLWHVVPTVDFALTLQPKTKKVVFVAGNTPIDQERIVSAREEMAGYGKNIEFDYLTDRSMEAMASELSNLSPGTVVVYLSFLQDGSGKSFSATEAVNILSRASSVPMYGTTSTQFGAGIVGGYITGFDPIGLLAGKTGLRILAGEKADTIPVTTLDNATS
jgi:hypothetical protein